MKALPKHLLSFFWYFLKRRTGTLLLLQLLCMTWALEFAIWPLLIGKFIDAMKAISDSRELFWEYLGSYIGVALSLWIGAMIAYRIAGYLWAYMLPKLESEIRMEMFEYAQGHSHKFFSDHLSGSIAYNINTMVTSFVILIEMIILLGIPAIGQFIVSSFLFFTITPYFGLILFCWALLYLAICIWTAPPCVSAAEQHGKTRSILQGAIVDSLSNYVSVKLFAHEKSEEAYIGKLQKSEIKAYALSEMVIVKVSIYLGILTFGGIWLGLGGYALYGWKEGWATPGEVIFTINTIWNSTIMAWLIGTSIPTLYHMWGLCKQSLSFIEIPHDIHDGPHAHDLVVTRGEITFENVSFGYKSKKLFYNKDLTIHHGEKVGLVGYSGAGKTTFVQLILRFYNLDNGRILIDGQDIAKVTLTSLRRQVAVIPQDPQLFNRTVYDNIYYGRIEASQEEVIHAAKLARCHDFIMELPEGYQTRIGDRGAKLSGGQRQRVAIARAFLANVKILILDEATSALDSKTEVDIQEALKLLMQGRTTIVIAHRLSTLRGMDRILVFEAGKVMEEGSHAALIAMDGIYANMWKLQVGGMMPDESEDEESL